MPMMWRLGKSTRPPPLRYPTFANYGQVPRAIGPTGATSCADTGETTQYLWSRCDACSSLHKVGHRKALLQLDHSLVSRVKCGQPKGGPGIFRESGLSRT